MHIQFFFSLRQCLTFCVKNVLNVDYFTGKVDVRNFLIKELVRHVVISGLNWNI